MTTARERIKELSGLTGLHSAREHLAAITQGGGTGPAKTVFASRMAVCMEAPQITVVRRPAITSNSNPAQKTSPSRGERAQKGHVDILKVDNRIDVFTRTEVIFIISRKHQDSFVRMFENSVSVRKSRLVGVV